MMVVLEEEWMSFHELPFLGNLWFWMVLERLFAHLSSPSMCIFLSWESVFGEFIPPIHWFEQGMVKS